ncbi:3-phosphoshikimate 1-carboxyvinyltransferase [Thermoclostridium caenicola]|uniref:3-phosphoshikimate 1-carboxyvinyltransferase n=1 Tax=Thermoclostridium caenicola TaxID=659425 RepID=A0A1M6EXR3_9FIRM|nr:3-phosphoshikimate 1-carboxyvinyltransferase [Thermoclostridium caenicola]SHI90171.1 3-phosphoshikimate 1-carboxyvinyltransferase [Thermoclostridium caenicola]HOL83725.1 3-phosphoshikimate 1-carboxyvinyltransferase [Thermoclostridium caenicola]HPO75702.1 3-phosphoshikimate 1-carboxyvinyltransferase [Thermoclostridium caenicola]HPU21836.1 3-phosphoshikimate 1-carboxyvinyltransferase [Thermoclostridium caenicola]
MPSLRIESRKLSGRIFIQPSKSMAHRLILCALLARGTSVIDNIVLSDDIRATLGACQALGAGVSIEDSPRFANRKRILLSAPGEIRLSRPEIDCMESGTTARFIIPVSRLCADPVTLTGRGRLVKRPFDVYKSILPGKGVGFEDENGRMPIRLSGRLNPGEYELRGDVSSQFISGLLMALPFLEGDSTIRITGPLESRPYVEMTLDALHQFGISVEHSEDYRLFRIRGGQKAEARSLAVEGDWSQAAFFCVLGAISGEVAIDGLSKASLQGDRVILDFVRAMGADTRWEQDTLLVRPGTLKGIEVDASQCPDLVPAVAVAAALCEGKSLIGNARRLRLKESDRLSAVCSEINKIGGHVEEMEDGLVINGVGRFRGATVDGWNDHRIVMSLAIASSCCDGPMEINGYEAVSKSYPEFWDDFRSLGGRFDEQHMG